MRSATSVQPTPCLEPAAHQLGRSPRSVGRPARFLDGHGARAIAIFHHGPTFSPRATEPLAHPSRHGLGEPRPGPLRLLPQPALRPAAMPAVAAGRRIREAPGGWHPSRYAPHCAISRGHPPRRRRDVPAQFESRPNRTTERITKPPFTRPRRRREPPGGAATALSGRAGSRSA